MDTNNLNIFYFLVYIEIMLLVLGLLRTIVTFFVGIILAIFNVRDDKQDMVALWTEIPLMFILLLTTTHLAFINTVDASLGLKILYYLSAAVILLVFRLLHQKDVYGLADKEGNILLEYYARKYFRITLWIFFILFLILIFGPFKTENPITSFCISSITWVLNIKFIGWLIPWFAGILLVGTLYMGFAFLVVLIYVRKANE